MLKKIILTHHSKLRFLFYLFFIFLLSTVLLSINANKAQAATIYVSLPDATHPPASGAGTSASPYRSLKVAITNAANGDTINLSNGTHILQGGAVPYTDPSCGNCDGSPTYGGFAQNVPTTVGFHIANKALTFQGTSRTSTIIQASAEYGMLFENTAFTTPLTISTIKNLTITGAIGDNAISGSPTAEIKETRSAVVIRNMKVIIDNVTIRDNSVRGVSVREGGNLEIRNSSVLNSNWDSIGLYQSNPSVSGDDAYALIEDNLIGSTTSSPNVCVNLVEGGGVGVTNDARAEIRQNTIQCHWKGIVMTANRGVSSTPIKVFNNKIQYNAAYGFYIGNPMSAGSIVLDARNNVIAKNARFGVDLNFGSTSVTGKLINNIFYENGNAAISGYEGYYPRAGLVVSGTVDPGLLIKYNAFVNNQTVAVCNASALSGGVVNCTGDVSSSYIGVNGNLSKPTPADVFVSTTNEVYALKCNSGLIGYGDPAYRNNGTLTDRSDIGVNGGIYPFTAAPDCYGICNKVTQTSPSATSVTIPSFTGCSGSANDIVVVIASYRSVGGWATQNITGMTYGGQALTKGCRSNSNEYATEVWYRVNPVNSGTLVANWNLGAAADIVLGTAVIGGVNTTSTVSGTLCTSDGGAWSSNPTIGMNPNVSVVHSTNRLIFGGMTTYTGYSNSVVFDNGLTNELWNVGTTNVKSSVGLVSSNLSSPTQLGWTGNVSWPWSAAGISIRKL